MEFIEVQQVTGALLLKAYLINLVQPFLGKKLTESSIWIKMIGFVLFSKSYVIETHLFKKGIFI